TRLVALNNEERRRAACARAEGLRRLLRVALAPVLAEPLLRLRTHSRMSFSPEKPGLRPVTGAGEKPVESVDWRTGRRVANGFSGVNAERPERAPPGAAQIVASDTVQLVQGALESLGQQPRRLIVIRLGPFLGLEDDRVDHAELETVRGVGLERRGGLARLAG